MRKVFSVISIIGACFSLSVAVASSAFAQKIGSLDLDDYPEPIKKQILAIATNHSRNKVIRPIEIKYPHPFYPEDWVSDRPITVHLRGTSGTPLPAPKRHRSSPEQQARDVRAAQLADQQIGRNAEIINERYKNLPRLPVCSKDSKSFRDFAEPFGNGSLSDILFIDPEQMPTDPKEVFGANTHVVAYDTKKNEPDTLLIYTFDVKCLPSRHRILARGISREEGVPALKNYDNDFYGPGTLHESMRNRSGRLFDEAGNSL